MVGLQLSVNSALRSELEEIVDGMQEEHEGEEEHNHEDAEYDEHVWLSLRNAAFFCQYIRAAVQGRRG